MFGMKSSFGGKVPVGLCCWTVAAQSSSASIYRKEGGGLNGTTKEVVGRMVVLLQDSGFSMNK